jgi:hypothetical protein
MIVKYYRFVLERNVLEVLTTKEPEIECRTDVWGPGIAQEEFKQCQATRF